MNTYKSPDGSLHCIEQQFEYLLPAGSERITDDEAEEIRLSQISSSDAIKMEINRLESTITQRRIRECILGIDGGWLANIDAEIAILRSKL